MSQLISSFPIGTIYYQSGYGVPTHIATKGCTYIDVNTGTMYINKDGVVNWEEILGTPFDYIHFNTGQTTTYNGGDLFWVDSENALSYKPYTTNNDVTVNLGQESLIRVYNDLGYQINNGQALYITGTTINTIPTVALANASKLGITFDDSLAKLSGVATHDIPNNHYGFITNFGVVRGVNTSALIQGREVFLSDTIDGGLTTEPDSINISSRVSTVGYCLKSDLTNGSILVDINNENSVLTLTDLERNVLEGNVISTGIFDFSGLTKTSNTTFNVAPVKGWVVKNTYENALKPDVISINYSGQTGLTTPYLVTNSSTYVLVNSASTISLLPTPPTPRQRRENIYLGKIIHPDKTIIQNVNNTTDYDVSPMSSLRDLFTPIKLINDGIVISPNGINLSFNKTQGNIWGYGIGWYTDQMNPNMVTLSATSPTTFQYRTQTGGTFSDVTVIDPTYYDVNGVRTLIPGNNGSQLVRATNHRVYQFSTGVVRVQYGQTWYESLTEAVTGLEYESFNEYINNKENGILIGIISATRHCVDLTDTTRAKLLFTSKFGELGGGTGGLSTTTLQQAYNNSIQPEIVTNSTLNALTIKNGTGNADNVTRLLEGINTAGDTTSFIRADGGISGTTIQTNLFLLNSTGLTQSSGFTILSNLSTLNAVNDAGAAGLGVPLYGLYRNGNVVQIRIT